VKSTVRWGGQTKALTAWRRGSVWCAREMGSRFSQLYVGHREILGPRRNPRMDVDPSVTALRPAPETFRPHRSKHVNVEN
jgi:hypothetical protein